MLFFVLGCAAALTLAHYVYTLIAFGSSQLHSRPLPLLGHLHVLFAAMRKADGDLARAFRAILEDRPACTLLLGPGNNALALVQDPAMMRAVLSATDFNHRPRAPKWEIGSLVSGDLAYGGDLGGTGRGRGRRERKKARKGKRKRQ